MAADHGTLVRPPAPILHAGPRRTRPSEPAVTALIVTVFLLLLLFVAFPLAMVLSTGFTRDGAWTLAVYRDLLGTRTAGVPLRNSLLLGVTVGAAGTVVGYVSAYILTMTAIPGRRALRFIATLPMIAPPFMIALAAIMLFGRNGVLTRHVLIPLLGAGNVPEIYGFGGLVLVQTLTYFPVSLLLLAAVLGAIDPALEEAAQNQGAGHFAVFRDVILPLSIPGLLSSFLLLFIESLADFGNPLILGGNFRVLSVAAFLRITGEFDTASGAVLATLLLFPALVAFFVQRYYVQRTAFATVGARATSGRRADSPAPVRVTAVALGVLIAGAVCLFYGAVVYGSFVRVWGVAGGFTLVHYVGALSSARAALTDSLLLAALATPITGVFGLGVAWLLVRRRFAGRSVMSVLTMLTFAVPGTVVGIGYVLAFNRPPLQLTGTAAIIVLLFVFRNAPVGIEAGTNAIRQVDPSIEEGSASLGAPPLATFRRIVMPLAAPAFFAGLAHSFVRCMTAISAVIFVVSGQWNLVTVSILGFVENSDLARGAALCMIVVALVSIVLSAMRLVVARMERSR